MEECSLMKIVIFFLMNLVEILYLKKEHSSQLYRDYYKTYSTISVAVGRRDHISYHIC